MFKLENTYEKIIISRLRLHFFSRLRLYGTTQYNIRLDAQQADFSRPEDLKMGSTCTFLVLGFIPWPWHKTKTPDTLLGALIQADIHQVVWIDSTYDYKFTYAYSCKNVYGY